ncbi:MAG: alpha/beta hydrolase [Nocardioidaceae bacterium]|nr:alpha/beta hydrolase [Nocardioidaceae bacterium]
MPSIRHEVLARGVPWIHRAREIDDLLTEKARLELAHRRLDRSFPSRAVPGFAKRFRLDREDAGGFPSYVVTPRDVPVKRTLVYVHGGAFVAPIDPFHVRWTTRLALATGARVVLPDYPLTPESTWQASHEQIVDLTARWAAEPGGTVLAGDSSGGNIALAVALTMRDRGLSMPGRMVLHAPWVDLTMTAPGTPEAAGRDPWLHLGKAHAYARWWAGRDDLTLPQLSPVNGDLDGLPPALMLYGTRDLLAPGCQLIALRARASTWDLTVVEEPDLIHVYSLMPLPEARRAFRTTVEFLG